MNDSADREAPARDPREGGETPVPPARDETPVPPARDETPEPPARDETPEPPARDVTPVPLARTETPEPPARIETSEPPARTETPAPSAAKARPVSPDVPVLAVVRPLAAVAVVAMILGRILGPAAPGILVGIDRVMRGLELAGAIATQLFAMAAIVVMLAEIIAVVDSKLPVALRLAAIFVSGFGIIVALFAVFIPVPSIWSAVLGTGAALLAIAAAWDARRAPFARVFALALALLAAAGLARIASIGLADLANVRASVRLGDLARGAATVSFAIDALALLVAMTVFASGSKKLTSPLTVIALVLAFVATRQALSANADDAGHMSLLLRRAAERLMSRPEPFVPIALRIFVSVLAVLAAGLALFARGHVPALAGALSLALLARGAPDMPLGALVLILAAMSTALAARDDRGVWVAIAAGRLRSGDGSAAEGAVGATPARRGGERGDGPPRDVPRSDIPRAG